MLHLSDKWGAVLLSQPESGMDYQIVSVFLRDGRRFDNVAVIGATLIKEVNGKSEIPFTEEDIVDIRVMNMPQRH